MGSRTSSQRPPFGPCFAPITGSTILLPVSGVLAETFATAFEDGLGAARTTTRWSSASSRWRACAAGTTASMKTKARIALRTRHTVGEVDELSVPPNVEELEVPGRQSSR